MQLVHEFEVQAPLQTAWSVLTDIPTVIGCVPGAGLDRADGDDYHAHVAVKVGPVGVTLAGTARLMSRDDIGKEMLVVGSARDRKGNGSTEAAVRITAREEADRCVVTVTTDVELSGRIAQFGTGVIEQVSNRIIGQFVGRLDAVIAGDGAPTDTARETAESVRIRESAPEWAVVALTAAAGVALGLAVGRWADRVSLSPRR